MKILRLRLLAFLFTTLLPAPGNLYSQSAPPEFPKGNVTVNFWGIATQPWQVMIDAFQKKYPNIKIKWTKYSTDEIKQALRVASAAGKMPDAWFNWGGSLASPYEEGGHALELTPRADGSVRGGQKHSPRRSYLGSLERQTLWHSGLGTADDDFL